MNVSSALMGAELWHMAPRIPSLAENLVGTALGDPKRVLCDRLTRSLPRKGYWAGFEVWRSRPS